MMRVRFSFCSRALAGAVSATVLATVLATAALFSADAGAAHAFSLYDTPKYPAGFSHFDYLNPEAPKGGDLYLANPDSRTSFDKFNPFSMKGVAAAGVSNLMFESLAITSADRLNAGWTVAQRARARGHINAHSAVEVLLQDLPLHCCLITVIDGHPATLAWLGSVWGHRTIPLGVEHFGQTGTISDLYCHYAIDADSIVKRVSALTL